MEEEVEEEVEEVVEEEEGKEVVEMVATLVTSMPLLFASSSIPLPAISSPTAETNDTPGLTWCVIGRSRGG